MNEELETYKERFDILLKSQRYKWSNLSLYYKPIKLTNDSQISIIEDSGNFYVYKTIFSDYHYEEMFVSTEYYSALEYFCDLLIEIFTYPIIEEQ